MWTGGYKLWFFWTHSISRWMYSVSKVKSRWDCSVAIECAQLFQRTWVLSSVPISAFDNCLCSRSRGPDTLIWPTQVPEFTCTHIHADVHIRHTNKNKINLKEEKELDLGWKMSFTIWELILSDPTSHSPYCPALSFLVCGSLNEKHLYWDICKLSSVLRGCTRMEMSRVSVQYLYLLQENDLCLKYHVL